MIEEHLVKSYIWHKGKCYFISTIERDSSAAAYPVRYSETIVWEFDWDKREAGKMVHQDEGIKNNIDSHLRIVLWIFHEGAFWDKGEE